MLFRKGDTYTIENADGTVSTLVGITLGTNVLEYGLGQQNPYLVENGETAKLGGTVKFNGTVATTNVVLLTVAADFRPIGLESFVVSYNGGYVSVEVLTNGQVIVRDSLTPGLPLSLAGIEWLTVDESGTTVVEETQSPYLPNDSFQVTFPAGFKPYGYTFQVPEGRYYENGQVVLQGLIAIDTAVKTVPLAINTVIGYIPPEYAPVGTVIFNCMSDAGAVRVDIKNNGEIVFVKGSNVISWFSLGGFAFNSAENPFG
jgi:hypothetical protein